jgi:hypothetical protein
MSVVWRTEHDWECNQIMIMVTFVYYSHDAVLETGRETVGVQLLQWPYPKPRLSNQGARRQSKGWCDSEQILFCTTSMPANQKRGAGEGGNCGKKGRWKSSLLPTTRIERPSAERATTGSENSAAGAARGSHCYNGCNTVCVFDTLPPWTT